MLRRVLGGFSARSAVLQQQVRCLNVHEYTAKQLMRSAGCTVEYGIMVTNLSAAEEACAQIPTTKKVVKAQILAGGRGKGCFDNGFQGGVHICENTEEALKVVHEMLGRRLITKQSGPAGLTVNKVYIAECLPSIKQEYYFALLLDRTARGPAVLASREGGMDIETVAKLHPEKIIKQAISIHTGLTHQQGVEVANLLEITGSRADRAASEFVALYELMRRYDAAMVEINPFVELENGKFLCADAKIRFDDNAHFRQKTLWAHEDYGQLDAREVEASKWDLNYVGLDGNVGCLVNGAGLAMATMDIIHAYGCMPANFLDVGGGAKTEQVSAALDIIQRDPKVQAILINIFGGIMKCDTIAQGIIDSFSRVKVRVPLVVRLSGTNAAQGKQMLQESKLAIVPADDLDEAASIVADLVKKQQKEQKK